MLLQRERRLLLPIIEFLRLASIGNLKAVHYKRNRNKLRTPEKKKEPAKISSLAGCFPK